MRVRRRAGGGGPAAGEEGAPGPAAGAGEALPEELMIYSQPLEHLAALQAGGRAHFGDCLLPPWRRCVRPPPRVKDPPWHRSLEPSLRGRRRRRTGLD